MVIPELKTLISADLEYGQLPIDAEDCEICCEAEIGLTGQDGGDIFFLTVITTKRLARQKGYIWGKGYLIVESFSWQIVEKAIEKLLSHCRGASWIEVAGKLNSVLGWEFENYQASPKR